MGMMINKLVEPIWGYEPIDGGGIMFVSESSLNVLQRGMKKSKPFQIALPGLDRPQNTSNYFSNARTLARIAKDVAAKEKCQTGTVLFRDTDGTRSDDRTERSVKIKSMESGFAAESFAFGVPMVPQPKSEAWLLCALQAKPYQNCTRLEAISGNDDSPQSAKKQLESALGHKPNATELADLVSNGSVDVQQIDMPSFDEFRQRMSAVAHAMLSAPAEPDQH
jgi:hypothetical protein